MTDGDPTAALQADMTRLEDIRTRLAAAGDDPEQVKELADAALAVSERITGLLPGLLEVDDDT